MSTDNAARHYTNSFQKDIIMRVLLTGGGTGGHVNPALAIADIIKSNIPDAEIAYVGTKKGIENKLVAKEGYKIFHIEIQGIKRSLSLSNLKTAYYVFVSPHRAKKIIKEFKPDIVIGTGGYVCWPTLRAAASMGIPTMVHESNALAGVAVRQLQGKVDKILTNFAETAEQLSAKSKIINVGNPLRSAYGYLSREEARAKLGIPDSVNFVILSFGGSLGAAKVNSTAIQVMKDFVLPREDVMHFHSGGSIGFEEAKKLFAEAGLEGNERTVLKDYIYDMPLYMAAADLVISRAGAMTLTALARMGKAAIVIPSPNVTDNHQYKNAKALADKGAACLLEERELEGDAILRAVEEIYSDEGKREAMSQSIRAFAKEDAGKRIFEEMMKLIKSYEKIVRD